MGGSVTFHRQFVESSDFDVFVVSDKDCRAEPLPSLQIGLPAWLERLKRTRLSRWVHDYINVYYGASVFPEVEEAAREFRPDLIYTVPGTWIARMARALSQRFDVPLAAHFMDWGTYNVIGHDWAIRKIDWQFRQFYRECDLSFCICDGMRQELGEHPNAVIHYPIGADREVPPESHEHHIQPPVEVAFAGNLGEWYGDMIAVLAAEIDDEEIAFKVYGGQHSWSDDTVQNLTARGIFQGFQSFDVLSDRLREADVLLLPMGFAESCALTERTSFKTKWVDYVTFNKPVVIWGPEDCSAVQLARQYDSAECCTELDPHAAVATIRRLSSDPQRRMNIVQQANQMWEELLAPEAIRRIARRALEDVARRGLRS